MRLGAGPADRFCLPLGIVRVSAVSLCERLEQLLPGVRAGMNQIEMTCARNAPQLYPYFIIVAAGSFVVGFGLAHRDDGV